MKPASIAWMTLLRKILEHGQQEMPRDQLTLELLHESICVDMRQPVVLIPERKLNYSFMAAEALWILAGDNLVEPLARYNQRMREFSDDGIHLAGAYGPKISAQMDYVVESLLKDRSTRQAVLTIWERNPAPSKDIPCTLALQFMIRSDKLHCHVFMRSSDAWLGVPYDIFSFSMVAAAVACRINLCSDKIVSLGNLYLTAGSSHLYTTNLGIARILLESNSYEYSGDLLPEKIIHEGDYDELILSLMACRDKHDGGSWRIRP